MNEKLVVPPTQAAIGNEDYRYEPPYAAKEHEASTGLYRYASVGSLGGSGGGGVSAYRIAGVPTEFGGTLKSSKGSSTNHSPHKQGHRHSSYCSCFGGGERGGHKKASVSFWPTMLANLGICALLLGYILIGSLVFLTIENSGGPDEREDETAASWRFSQMPQLSPQQQQLHNLQQQTKSPHQISAVDADEAAAAPQPIFANNNNDNGTQRAQGIAKSRSYSVGVSGSVFGAIATPEAETYSDNMHEKSNDDDGSAATAAAAASNNANVDYELQTMNMAEREDVERQRTVENIWDITVSLNILYKENWTKLAALEIAKFQDQLVKRLVMDLTLSVTNEARGSNVGTPPMGQNTKHFSGQNEQQPKYFHQRLGQLQQERQLKAKQFEWNFATAFLYSLTVITTVGYGTIMPRTTLGRMVTIGYATVGIPLTLIYLSSIGGILAKLVRTLCTRALCCCFCKRQSSYCGFSQRQQVSDRKCDVKLKQLHQQQQQQQQQHLPYCYVRPPAEVGADINATAMLGGSSIDTLSVTTSTAEGRHTQALGWSLLAPVGLCLLLMLAYVAVGSLVISLLEHWSLIDGVYFCFMSLTTIGFCDLLPGANRMSSSSSSSSVVVWFCAVYILSGLTLTSMCVNLLHEEILLRMRVVVKLKKVAAKESKERGFYGAPP